MIATRREGNLPGRIVRCGRYVALGDGDGDACGSDVIITSGDNEKERRLKKIQEMTSANACTVSQNISSFMSGGNIQKK